MEGYKPDMGVEILNLQAIAPSIGASRKTAIATHAEIIVLHMYTTWHALKSNSTID